MSDALSLAEIDAQRLELLPARTVLSCHGGGHTFNDFADDRDHGDHAGAENENANENTSQNANDNANENTNTNTSESDSDATATATVYEYESGALIEISDVSVSLLG